MSWTCAAIKHGVTIFPDGKIGPCCQIDATYLKPIAELTNPDRFSDLNTEYAPEACKKCTHDEFNDIPSYREMFNARNNKKSGLQFVDIRNTNLCNLKCRYCGPHFSSQWAEELGSIPAIKHQDLSEYKNILRNELGLQWMYFTGGEPLISKDHWDLLEDLVDIGQSSQMDILYNTNLTTIKYKDKSIIDIWKQFKSVSIQCSIDAIGKPLDYIRSGADWTKINSNLLELLEAAEDSNITITFSPTLTILNIWFIDELYQYAQEKNIRVNLNILTGPDYLALNVIPDSLKSLALDKIDCLESIYNVDKNIILHIKSLINNNTDSLIFNHTMSHVLLLDNLRGEKLFDLLPFKSFAVDTILKNHEYE